MTLEEKREYHKKWIEARKRGEKYSSRAGIPLKTENLAQYYHEYYAAHREEKLAYGKAYYRKNKTRLQNYKKEWNKKRSLKISDGKVKDVQKSQVFENK